MKELVHWFARSRTGGGLVYVDPGYGALILQSLIAGTVGTLFVAKKKLAVWLRSFLNEEH